MPAIRTRRPYGALGALLALGVVATAGAPGVLRISRGDTLSGIALRNHTTVAALEAANSLSSDRIYAGDTLLLPGAGSATPTATSTASAVAHRSTLATRTAPSRSAVRALVASTAKRYGVDPSLALAVSYQESGFQQRVVSGVDAVGAMQVLPRTAAGLSAQAGRDLDVLDVQDNVTAGVLLLRTLLRSTGSEHAAVAAYYQGVGSIAAKGLLPQTVQYLADVDALKARFRNG